MLILLKSHSFTTLAGVSVNAPQLWVEPAAVSVQLAAGARSIRCQNNAIQPFFMRLYASTVSLKADTLIRMFDAHEGILDDVILTS